MAPDASCSLLMLLLAGRAALPTSAATAPQLPSSTSTFTTAYLIFETTGLTLGYWVNRGFDQSGDSQDSGESDTISPAAR